MNYKKQLNGIGEVELLDFMGGDITVVNSARVSYGKKVSEMTANDRRLIRFLWSNGHTSPFRHCVIQFRVLAPIFVLRQWMKHQIGCAWNERSGRYTEFSSQFYNPDVIFEADPDVKQGKHSEMKDQTVKKAAKDLMNESMIKSFDTYQDLLEAGLSKEQARTVLPVGMLSECYWTCSLHALLHFLELRLDVHTQHETRLFAKHVYDLVRQTQSFETCLDMWRESFLLERQDFDIQL